MISRGRTAALCIFLFLASALISIRVRSHHISHLPCLLGTCRTRSQKPAYAFATFLGVDPVSTTRHEEEDDDEETSSTTSELRMRPSNHSGDQDLKDGYYQGVRVLQYQLLHNPETRSNSSIPFLVIVTSDVSAHKRARLAADGATVVLVERLRADWVHPASERWRDVMVKIRLFQLTQYEKICFIDADMLITAPLDGVFDDPTTDMLRTGQELTQLQDDEAPLPPTYMFAGKPDIFGYNHEIPPPTSDYFNAGFFVFHPSQTLFNYYTSLLKLPGRFDAGFPEQGLLNYAHRREGNMPWTRLNWRWNANWPTMADFRAEVRSFHAKYWDDDPGHDVELREMWWRQWAEMMGFYKGVEAGRSEEGW